MSIWVGGSMAKSGIRWKGDGPSKMAMRIKDAGTNVESEVFDNLIALGHRGAQRVKAVVETSGTDTNPQGRIETGDMRSKIKSSHEISGHKIRVNFGWLDSDPRYTIFQEEGTVGGQGNGKGIEAMNSLLHAYIEVKAYVLGKGLWV